MIDLRRLEIFCAVARTGSLAGAARELSYSTPAVWQHMKRLEAEIGQPLMVTHSRGVNLTAAGEILARHGEHVLRRVRLAQAELDAVERLEAGALRVDAFATACSGLLPEPIARFRAAHPDVRFVLSEHDPSEALTRVQHGDVDLAVVFAYRGDVAEQDGLRFTWVLDDPLYVVLPAKHSLAAQSRVRLEQLDGEGWLKGSYLAEREGGDASGEAAGANLAYAGGDFHTVQRLVASGTSVALVPRLALGDLRDDVAVRPLAGIAQTRRIFAATRRPPAVNAATERFLSLLLEASGTLRSSWSDDRDVVGVLGGPHDSGRRV